MKNKVTKEKETGKMERLEHKGGKKAEKKEMHTVKTTKKK